ncbi:hypothetical protein [Streptomyces gardneri]|uniref:Uncharacterized protein n=1 Tax=Streptomyces gardneri TaxID=66892 RepID=A0A4Y3RXS6_9ACTN|nr:hypothetical protein [Streptomyces gardneri]GEB62099.1 hypothetical protein SGA01_77040 [Streptomyces gardneri]GHH23505.1 hypothetical protein GCM10017674_80160 [Streptomyces gardneri]
MRFHPFPDDLVTAQRSWTAAYEELAQPGTTRTTTLRRRLLRLSTQVYFHPYWAHPRPAAERAELRDLVRADRAREVRAA